VPARFLLLLVTFAALGGAAAVATGDETGGTSPPASTVPAPAPSDPPIRWRRSRAVGKPWRGRLVRGVLLPPQGADFFTWDPILNRAPNRAWRRWGHDRLIRTLLRVLREYRTENPGAPRVGVGDLSRPRGGWFGKRFGGLGHASHQNGLDVDLFYPRFDRRERRPAHAGHVDDLLAQRLVDRFVTARAEYVFVGPHLDLIGPRRVVQRLVHHDDHMHVRIRPRPHGR
jgi:murein endopeptidase